MRIDWILSSRDIKRVKDYYNSIKYDREDSKYVHYRIERNIERKKRALLA